MEINVLGQVVVNGLLLGSVYSLLALGVTLIFSIMNIVNFAHGNIYMLGAFIFCLLAAEHGLNFFAAAILTVLLIGSLGILLERVFFRPLRGMHDQSLLVALGLALLIEGCCLLSFGEHSRGIESIFKGSVRALGITVPTERLVAILSCFAVVAGLFYFLHRTRQGRAMRALAQDMEAATLQGINVDTLSWIGFAIGCAMAGIAGVLLVPIFWVDITIGTPAVIKAFTVLVIGGLGSVPGAVVGGLILGMIESFGFTYLPGTWAGFIFFALVVLVLIARPEGMFGRHEA